MFKNYLKMAFRHLKKRYSYNSLNIIGLTVGITCAAMILLWVEDELRYDSMYKNKEHLYRVVTNQTEAGSTSTLLATSGRLGPALKAEVPGIKNTARLSFNQHLKLLFSVNDKPVYEQGYYTDSSFFSMLTIPFKYGAGAHAFDQLYSLVISESMAQKMFGNVNPVGKTIRVNNEQDFTVTGVFEDLPGNSTLKFQWLSPFAIFEAKRASLKNWHSIGVNTLVELQPGVSEASVNAKLYNFLKTKADDLSGHCFLYAMRDWHLHSSFTDGKLDEGRMTYVKIFFVIAITIILIACINFMNLATASSEKRAKEIGIRKVMGAVKGRLISQFLFESLLMSFISILIAVGLIFLLLPAFNRLVEKDMSFQLFKPLHIGVLLLVGIITGVIAGTYPAFYLSSFNPIGVLKGIKIKLNAGGSNFIRKTLVVVQFTVSIILIISTLIIYQQVNYVKNRKLGYNKDNLVYFELQGSLKDHYHGVFNDLLSTGYVQNASLSSDPLLQVGSNSDNPVWQGKDLSVNTIISIEHVSPEYLTTMGMQLVAGRPFYTNSESDSSNIIINEKMARQMGGQGKVGSIVTVWNKQYTVIAIVKDFLFNDMYAESAPLIIFCNPEKASYMTIRLTPGSNLKQSLAGIERIITGYNPGYPFEYAFVDEDFDRLFKAETLIGKLSTIFASLAIFISCLGLFGLAAFTAERRAKEISIRKLLGSSVSGIVVLLSKDFLQLIFISCVLAFPVALWTMYKWLMDYQYRTEIKWWVFALAALIALFIALITVTLQTLKAAFVNPSERLRAE